MERSKTKPSTSESDEPVAKDSAATAMPSSSNRPVQVVIKTPLPMENNATSPSSNSGIAAQPLFPVHTYVVAASNSASTGNTRLSGNMVQRVAQPKRTAPFNKSAFNSWGNNNQRTAPISSSSRRSEEVVSDEGLTVRQHLQQQQKQLLQKQMAQKREADDAAKKTTRPDDGASASSSTLGNAQAPSSMKTTPPRRQRTRTKIVESHLDRNRARPSVHKVIVTSTPLPDAGIRTTGAKIPNSNNAKVAIDDFRQMPYGGDHYGVLDDDAILEQFEYNESQQFLISDNGNHCYKDALSISIGQSPGDSLVFGMNRELNGSAVDIDKDELFKIDTMDIEQYLGGDVVLQKNDPVLGQIFEDDVAKSDGATVKSENSQKSPTCGDLISWIMTDEKEDLGNMDDDEFTNLFEDGGENDVLAAGNISQELFADLTSSAAERNESASNATSSESKISTTTQAHRQIKCTDTSQPSTSADYQSCVIVEGAKLPPCPPPSRPATHADVGVTENNVKISTYQPTKHIGVEPMSDEAYATYVERFQHECNVEHEVYYQRKLHFLKTNMRSILISNAAMVDEIARLQHACNQTSEERKGLAKRVQHHARNHIRRLQTAQKRRSDAEKRRQELGPNYATQVNIDQIKAKLAKIEKRSPNNENVPVAKIPELVKMKRGRPAKDGSMRVKKIRRSESAVTEACEPLFVNVDEPSTKAGDGQEAMSSNNSTPSRISARQRGYSAPDTMAHTRKRVLSLDLSRGSDNGGESSLLQQVLKIDEVDEESAKESPPTEAADQPTQPKESQAVDGDDNAVVRKSRRNTARRYHHETWETENVPVHVVTLESSEGVAPSKRRASMRKQNGGVTQSEPQTLVADTADEASATTEQQKVRSRRRTTTLQRNSADTSNDMDDDEDVELHQIFAATSNTNSSRKSARPSSHSRSNTPNEGIKVKISLRTVRPSSRDDVRVVASVVDKHENDDEYDSDYVEESASSKRSRRERRPSRTSVVAGGASTRNMPTREAKRKS